MTFIPERIIDEATDAIINVRDFCGDEKQAVREILSEHGLTNRENRNKAWRIAKARADHQWNGFRAQAGVKRIATKKHWDALR